MFILFMDDDQERHDIAEKVLSKHHTLIHTFEPDETLAAIESCQSRFGLAMLDHDLQCFGFENGRKIEKHGVYFVDKMLATIHEDKWPAEFLIHSYNPVGTSNMHKALYNKGLRVRRQIFTTELMNFVIGHLEAQ